MAKTIYAVLRARTNTTAMRQKIIELFPNEHHDLGNGEWFIVADAGTAQDLSDKLGIEPGGELGNGIVVSVSGYYGVAPSNTWEWLANRTRSTE